MSDDKIKPEESGIDPDAKIKADYLFYCEAMEKLNAEMERQRLEDEKKNHQ
jgi:hypothetical protein